MAAVYKSISKKGSKPTHEDVSDEDVAMDELWDGDETSDSEQDEEVEDAEDGKTQNPTNTAGQMPKTRVLMLTSRGVTFRYGNCVWFMFYGLWLIFVFLLALGIGIFSQIFAHSFLTPTRRVSWIRKRRRLVTTCC